MGIDLSPQHMYVYVSISNLSVLISIHIGLTFTCNWIDTEKMYEIYMRLTENSSYFIYIFLFIIATNRHLTNHPVVFIWANECPNWTHLLTFHKHIICQLNTCVCVFTKTTFLTMNSIQSIFSFFVDLTYWIDVKSWKLFRRIE